VSKLKVPVHALVFLLSMAVWWVFPSPSHIESIYAVGISFYVLVSNSSRREIWPALLMIIAVAAIQGPVTYYLFGQKSTSGQSMYFASIMLFDFALSFLLYAYHCSDRLLLIVGASIKRPFIPQVLGMAMILMFSALMTLPVLIELLVNYIDRSIFTGAPFFYRNYATMTNVSHCLINVAIWSMMLDAHYLRERLEQAKRSSIKL
jgi:hypothetical protein